MPKTKSLNKNASCAQCKPVIEITIAMNQFSDYIH
jgi:hypothetical protein